MTAACQGNVGEQILEALRMAKTPYFIITTNIEALKNGLYETDKSFLVPMSSHRDYISCLLKICLKEKIQVLIPGSAPELDVLSENREKFEEKGILVLLNSKEVIETCQDKFRTMEFLKKHQLLFPRFAFLEKPVLPRGLSFPLIIKPQKGGGGSRNVFLLQDQEDLNYYFSFFKKQELLPIVQEYVGDSSEEYTVGVLSDRDGRLIDSIVIKREVKGDLSVRAEINNIKLQGKQFVISSGFSQGMVDDYPEVKNYAEKIALVLDSRGPLNVQCRKTKKGVYTMEINPRFSGTAAIRALLGFNEPDTLIRQYLLGEKVNKIKYRKGLVLRDLRMVYITFNQIKKIKKQKYIANSGNRGEK